MIFAILEAVIDARVVKAVANAAKPVPMANTASPIAPMAAANASNPTAPADIGILATAMIVKVPARVPNAMAIWPIDNCPSKAIGGASNVSAPATNVIAAAPAKDPFAAFIAITTVPNAPAIVIKPLPIASHDIAPNATIGTTIKFMATATDVMPIAAPATLTPCISLAKATTSARIPAIAPNPLTIPAASILDMIAIAPDIISNALLIDNTPSAVEGLSFCLLTKATKPANSTNTAPNAISDLARLLALMPDITLRAADIVRIATAKAPICKDEAVILPPALDITVTAATSIAIVEAIAIRDLAMSFPSIVDITLRAAAMTRTALAKAVMVKAPLIAEPLLKLNLEM